MLCLYFMLIVGGSSVKIDTSKNITWNIGMSSFPDEMQRSLRERPRVRGVDSKGVIQVRKFVQMKQMISFMLGTNRWAEFDKFCGYGCWCFPDGANDIMLGKGPQLDEIDRTCYHLRQCYKCLQLEKCNYKDTSYTFDAYEDPVTNERHLVCDMEQNDCRRNLCECDREMAYEIVAKQDNWKRQLHERFGFDRETYCSGIGHQSQKDVEWQFSAIHELPGFERQNERCCGDYPKRHPFDSNRHECCDNTLVDIGNCLR